MKAKLQNPKALIGLAAAGGLLVLALGFVLLVSPQRSKAADLQAQSRSVESEIAVRRAALAAKPKVRVTTRASDLYRLTKAIPDRADMAGVLLEVNRLTHATGVKLVSFTPSQVVLGKGYNVQPVAVVVSGRYAQIAVFLKHLRRTVTVRRGKLDASGRLFSVDAVEFGSGDKVKFPNIKSMITLNAFVYAGGSAPANPTTTPGATPPSGQIAAGAGATP
jgi:Tfp pilus assembly protein PilO